MLTNIIRSTRTNDKDIVYDTGATQTPGICTCNGVLNGPAPISPTGTTILHSLFFNIYSHFVKQLYSCIILQYRSPHNGCHSFVNIKFSYLHELDKNEMTSCKGNHIQLKSYAFKLCLKSWIKSNLLLNYRKYLYIIIHYAST